MTRELQAYLAICSFFNHYDKDDGPLEVLYYLKKSPQLPSGVFWHQGMRVHFTNGDRTAVEEVGINEYTGESVVCLATMHDTQSDDVLEECSFYMSNGWHPTFGLTTEEAPSSLKKLLFAASKLHDVDLSLEVSSLALAFAKSNAFEFELDSIQTKRISELYSMAIAATEKQS